MEQHDVSQQCCTAETRKNWRQTAIGAIFHCEYIPNEDDNMTTSIFHLKMDKMNGKHT